MSYLSRDDLSTRKAFAAEYDRGPFLFNHALASCELLGLEPLRRLALKMLAAPNSRGFLRLGEYPEPFAWGSGDALRAAAQGFDQIETSGLRLKLTHINDEPGYREIVASCCEEIADLVGEAFKRDYYEPQATVFIASPGVITNWHVDSNANFLLHISGTKSARVMDGSNREFLKWTDLEHYWTQNGLMESREEFQMRAARFTLAPGAALHVPINFPHWVESESVTVSLSLAFTRKRDPIDVLIANGYLRRLQLQPRPPGESMLIDSVKRRIVRGARALRASVR